MQIVTREEVTPEVNPRNSGSSQEGSSFYLILSFADIHESLGNTIYYYHPVDSRVPALTSRCLLQQCHHPHSEILLHYMCVSLKSLQPTQSYVFNVCHFEPPTTEPVLRQFVLIVPRRLVAMPPPLRESGE